MSATKAWFGKHEGKELSEIPGGYLRWMVDNIDPVPLPKDTQGKSVEEVKAMTERMRDFISEAETELQNREENGSE